VAYSGGFKSRMLQRLTGPHAVSAKSLSRQVGVPASTLNYWLRAARRLVDMAGPEDSSPQSWTAEEKCKVVIEAAAVPEAELGEFLRKKGLHAAQLEEWRRLIKAAFTTGGKARTPADTADKKRLRELERELRRKDKALAEAAALLVLKKKLAVLWGDEDESTPTRKET
jgi:transposase